jgi:hypothetical protein
VSTVAATSPQVRKLRDRIFAHVRDHVDLRWISGMLLTATFIAQATLSGLWPMTSVIAGLSALCFAFFMITFAPVPVRSGDDAYAYAICMYCQRSTLRRYRNVARPRVWWARTTGNSPAKLDWGDPRQCPHHRAFNRALLVATALAAAVSIVVRLWW